MATTDNPGFDDVDTVRDPNEEDFNERHRLREVWDARQEMTELRKQIRLARGREMSEAEAERYFHDIASHYFEVLEPFFTVAYGETGRYYWNQAHIGTQTIPPPDRFAADVKPKQRQFDGLVSIIDAPLMQSVTFTGAVGHRTRQRSATVQETVEITVPWNITSRAIRLAHRFCAEVGMEVKASGDTDVHADPI